MSLVLAIALMTAFLVIVVIVLFRLLKAVFGWIAKNWLGIIVTILACIALVLAGWEESLGVIVAGILVHIIMKLIKKD